MIDDRPLVEQRFMGFVMPEPNTGCWLWMGSARPNGYSTFGAKADGKWKTFGASRLAYELFVGPIPEGLVLDHICSNGAGSCVNPSHLEPVTQKENSLRTSRRGRIQRENSKKTHCPKGHPYSGDNLYVRPGGWITCKKCRNVARDAKRAKAIEARGGE